MNPPSLSPLLVSATSNTHKVAGAIASTLREKPQVAVQAIGAAAVNQAVKAIILARSFLERDDLDLVLRPYFSEIEIEGSERTALRFIMTRCPREEKKNR